MPAEFGRILQFPTQQTELNPYASLHKEVPKPLAGGTLVDFGQRRQEQLKQQEYFFNPQWLVDNVARERSKPQPKGEVPWYFLPGTGFWVREQAAQLVRNTKGTMKDVAPTVLDLELHKVKEDKKAFVDEYLEGMLNLQLKLGWKDVNGEKRIVCPDYGDALWESIIDPKEREGAVYDALVGNKAKGEEGLESKIRKAPNGSVAVAISGAGWSGLHDADGRAIIFPESQIYVIKKDQHGELAAYTLRYKAKTDQNEKLQKMLGAEVVPVGDPRDRIQQMRERIKQVMKNTIVITPQDAAQAEREGRKPVRDFTDVVDLMQEAVGGKEVAYEGKTFDELRYLIKHPEAFTQHHPMIDPLIKRFQDYARTEIMKDQPLEELENKMQIAMAFTILQMNKLYREEENAGKTNGGELTVTNLVTSLNTMTHKEEVAHLQTRPGCAGGGQALVVTTMGGKRVIVRQSGIANAGQDGVGELSNTCTKGHAFTRRPNELENKCSQCDAALC